MNYQANVLHLNGFSNFNTFKEFSRKIIELYKPTHVALVTDINPSILNSLCDRFNEFGINVYVMETLDNEYMNAHQLPQTFVIRLTEIGVDSDSPIQGDNPITPFVYEFISSTAISPSSLKEVLKTDQDEEELIARWVTDIDTEEFIHYKATSLNCAILHHNKKGITVYQKSK